MSMTELVISKAKAEDSKDVALMAKWQSNLESLSAFDNDWDGEGKGCLVLYAWNGE